MSLSKYTEVRLVVQRPEASAYEASRAMQDNHIGAVIVHDGERVTGVVTDRDLALAIVAGDRDPFEVPLREIMSTPVVALPATASEADAARLMLNHHVRRIPIVDGQRVVGLVTLDDLLLEQAADGPTLAAIVRAQLSDPARLKRKGPVGPNEAGGGSAAARERAARRHSARAERSYVGLVERTRGLAHLPTAHAAEVALEEVLSAIVRRIRPEEAKQFLAQVPSLLADRLSAQLDGPDRRETLTGLVDTLAYLLTVDAERAAQIVRHTFEAIAQSISPGEVADVCAQLPADFRELLDPAR